MGADMSDPYKPCGRLAHSTENRVGQAWRAGSIQVMAEDLYGNVKMLDLPAGHFQCKYCLHVQKIVRVDERDFAACESCGVIYNDGQPRQEKMSNSKRKKLLERFKYDCLHKGD